MLVRLYDIEATRPFLLNTERIVQVDPVGWDDYSGCSVVEITIKISIRDGMLTRKISVGEEPDASDDELLELFVFTLTESSIRAGLDGGQA